jgi:LuxR family maltose regulon positive regulatory protein
MSPAIAKRVVLAFQKPARAAGDPALTERELAILTLLEVGRGYKGTATDLGISLNTVRSAVRKIYGKLQVHSLLEALERTRRLP